MGVLLDSSCVYFVVATFDGDIIEPATLTALSLLNRIDPHYTHMLVSDEKNDTEHEESILCNASEITMAEATKPNFFCKHFVVFIRINVPTQHTNFNML